MKTTKTIAKTGKAGMAVRTGVRGGGLAFNRCEAAARGAALKVKTGVRAGGIQFNRAERLQGRTGVRGGGMTFNRCEALAR